MFGIEPNLKIFVLFQRQLMSDVLRYFIHDLKKGIRALRIMKHIKLSGTNSLMPTVGLGTWQVPDDSVIENIVTTALKLGYRHIDTAFNYNNEKAIGRAIKTWLDDNQGTREELFITTKLPHIGNRPADVKKFLQMQLERLQLGYVDLYLIHVPFGFVCNEETLTPKTNKSGEYEIDMATNHLEIWKAMEDCKDENLTKNIGLSNFNVKQIQNIYVNCRCKPQVVQNELHAYYQQTELRSYCNLNDIVVTAYAPLGSPGAKSHFVEKYGYNPETFPDLLGNPVVIEVSEETKRTPAQVLLRFLLQQHIVVIPKTTSVQRLEENFNVYDFELSPTQMNRLTKLDRGSDGQIFNFLFWKGVEKHPEYPFRELIKPVRDNTAN